MKFFFDRNISHKITDALSALIGDEHEVRHLDQRFDKATPDETWISQLSAEKGWIIITADLKIRKRLNEKEVLKRAGFVTFFLTEGFGNVTGWDQVTWIINKWPQIVAQASKAKKGEQFKVPKSGKVRRFESK